MPNERILIVGGVAGGATAAARGRRFNEHAEIIMFERGPYISFANCGLPYYVGHEIGDRSALLLQTPDSFRARFHVDVRVLQEVIAINRQQKKVRIRKVDTGEEYEESYTSLVLSPGASPIRPPLPGIDSENVFTVRTVPDAVAIRDYIEQNQVHSAVVVGAGYIGLEMVEQLHHQNIHVTLVEKANQVMPPLDEEMAALIAGNLAQMGVEVILSDGIAGFDGTGKATAVRLESGRSVEGDLFILGLGVRPDIRMAREAGLEIGETGAIRVDDHMRTSDPSIYAAGDAVETVNLATGKPSWYPLAGPANKQGRVAGSNAAGDDMTFPGALGTAIARIGGMAAASTGLNEKTARKLGLDFFVSYSVSGNHADYYPGVQQMLIKIVAEKGTGRLLGAQLVGGEGVDKRCDIFSTAITAHMTVEDLTNLDLAYAPPFGSAKDPAIVAGMVGQNIRRESLPLVTPIGLHERLQAGANLQIVDVRPSYEFDVDAIPGAVNIHIDQLRGRLRELDPSKETVVYDSDGHQAYLAARILMQNGFRSVVSLTGGFTVWPVYQTVLMNRGQ